MAARETCLVVSPSTWFEAIGAPAPELEQDEYKVRCRIIGDRSQVVMAQIYELADVSGRFERLARGPQLRSIPKHKILREEPWHRELETAEHRGRTIEPQSYLADDGQWRPKAVMVTPHEGGSVRSLPIVAHLDITFVAESEANAYAIAMAKKWIDERS